MNKYELEKRFIKYAANILVLTKDIPPGYARDYFRDQLFRSGVSSSLNFAESMSAESLKDFIHKLNIALKELRESYCCIRIMLESGMLRKTELIDWLLEESDELISILVSSVQTSRRKLQKDSR